MSHTTKMVSLLSEFRRERNGLVADTMYYEGSRYGLNYGVSLPTLRRLVAEVGVDHDFARFLCRQQVRCLQLAALHLADPTRLDEADEATFWLNFLTNSELAEEAAYALLSRYTALPLRFNEWVAIQQLYAAYALLMALARTGHITTSHLEAAYATHRRHAHSLTAKALVVLSAAAVEADGSLREVVEQLTREADLPMQDYICDELAWRIQ